MPEEHDRSRQQELTLDSDLAELERLRAFIDDFSDRAGLPEQTRYHLNVALEELVVNAMKHGGCSPREGAIRLSMGIESGEVQMVLSDNGGSFDPLQAPPPDIHQDVLCRPVGGLGIHLVRCLIPGIRYERRGGRNYLYMTKPICREGNTDACCNGDHSR
jgi:serine/threonine-protein kinase RsbW